METNKALIGALIFIVLVVGANFIMYAIARGAARSDQKSFLEMLSQSLKTSPKKKEGSLDELRRKMQELEEDKKKDAGE
ncbi:MAG: hypothetical protein ACYC6R_13120 [Anaerolineales bacterium]